MPIWTAVSLGALAPATFCTQFDIHDGLSVRDSANRVEGVHSLPSPLTDKVLADVPELGSWENWYKHPRVVSNGHVHTILPAKLRKTRAVRYYRDLVPTPDGGTLAIDLLAGIRRKDQSNADASRTSAPSSLFTGGVLPGADEEEGFTQFVPEPPPLDASRPLLLLASGLGGGSQDTYVRSMAATAAERGWQVAVLNMRACGSSPVTSPRLFSAYRGANDDVRHAVAHLRRTRLGGAGLVAAVGWSNSGTILNNVLAEQATTHREMDPMCRIDAGASCATPLNMPANSANLQRWFHREVYDKNLGKSLRKLWLAARDNYLEEPAGAGAGAAGAGAASGEGEPIITAAAVRPVAQWDGLGEAATTFLADDALALTGDSIRTLDEAVTRRQYGFKSVDDYYENASSDQRLPSIEQPLLLLNAYDDPIVPGASLAKAVAAARANPAIVMALTSHGGHLGWCERDDPWGGPSWTERVACGFLESALAIEPATECETIGCEVFD